MALTTVPASLSATAITLTTAAQPNITSVGTLTGLTVNGALTATTIAGTTSVTTADFRYSGGAGYLTYSLNQAATDTLNIRRYGTVQQQFTQYGVNFPSGNVGIAASNPTEKLEVSGSINATNQSANFAAGAQRGFLDMVNASKHVRIGSLTGAATATGTQGTVEIVVNNSARVVVDENGHVGIGATNPNTNLQLYHATDDISINVNHGTGGSYPKKSGISFGAISTSLGGDATFTGGAGIQVTNTAATNNPTEMAFFTTSGGTPTTRMLIDSSGDLTLSGALVGTKASFDTTSTTDYALRLIDNGVASYDFTFPNTSTIQLGPNTTSTKEFKLANIGSGNFNLDVVGTITSSSTIQAVGTSTAAAFQLPWANDAIALQMKYDANYLMNVEFDAATRDLILTSSTNDATANIRFRTSGTGASGLADRLVIDHNGNVTLGNTSFGSSLGQLRVINDVVNSSPASLSLFGYNNVADGAEFAKLDFAMQTTGTGGQVVGKINGLAVGTGENAADLAFSVSHNGTLTERWRIHSDGPLVSQAQTPVSIGGTPADANFTELGSGYLNLARDDTADADQILFAKNGAIHSKLQTVNNAFVVHAEGTDIHFKTNQGGTARNINFSGSAPSLKPFDSNNGQIDLGTANAKFRSLYVNYLGAAADLRYLKGVYRKAVSVNKSFAAIFKVNGSALGSQFRFSVVGTTGNVVVNARYEILVNHSYDCTVQSLSGSYTETKVKIVSNANEDCTVYLAANTYNNNTASLNFEVETYNDEQISFDVSSPHTTAHFIHTATAGENTTFTGAMTLGAGTTTGYS